jgi:hypothetical protein
MSYIRQAFEAVCKEAKQAEGWYVVLMEDRPYYGGPEEGGWWGTDTTIVAYQLFPTEEQARAAGDKVQKLAAELEAEAVRAHGQQCLRELDWLEARGLEADFLPEPDGPARYTVLVTQGLPEPSYGPRRYE